MRVRGPLAPCVALVLAACASGMPTPGSGVSPSSAAAGEWVDVRKSTASDTTVWVLAADGDDALLTVHRDADGTRTEQRQHYGRWAEGRALDGAGVGVPALCFVRRPGRDAPSCDRFALDSTIVSGSYRRRLTVLGYVGAHHAGDRVMIERVPQGLVPQPVRETPGVSSDASAPDASTPGGSGAYHPRAVQPERPSVATHAGTVAAGYVELETGLEHDRLDDGTQALQLASLFKVGLARRVQVALSVPAAGATGVSFGAGDVAVGLKWRVVEDHPWLQDVALLPSVKFASGGDHGTGTTDVSLLLINSRTFGPIGVDLNVGATWRNGDGAQAPSTSTLWTVAAGIPVSGSLGWALETYGFPGTSGPAGSKPIVAVLTGPTWVVRPELALDVGVILPITGAQPRALYVGLVASFGRLVPR